MLSSLFCFMEFVEFAEYMNNFNNYNNNYDNNKNHVDNNNNEAVRLSRKFNESPCFKIHLYYNQITINYLE